MELTDAARANLERGAIHGPGTAVCKTCSGPKEDNRLNSAKCRTCNTPVGVDDYVKVHVPAGALALAEQRGTTLPAVVRALVAEWMGATPSTETAPDDAPVKHRETIHDLSEYALPEEIYP